MEGLPLPKQVVFEEPIRKTRACRILGVTYLSLAAAASADRQRKGGVKTVEGVRNRLNTFFLGYDWIDRVEQTIT